MSTETPRNPYPTVDVVIETPRGIVLIERKHEPRGWALPGGFIEYGEDPADAARREVMEETGLDVELTDLLSVYGDPSRDPRQHNLSIVYVGRADGEPAGGDDAANARVFALDDVPAALCFDHDRILADYRRFRATGARPTPKPASELELNERQRAALLMAARDAIEAVVERRAPRHSAEERDPLLRRAGASFVTLRTDDGSLRGCIGELEAHRPLIESVRSSAAGAATRDPRFEPMERDELDGVRIAISVLTPARIGRADEVIVGRHGLLIERGLQRGVLLPEVADENGWDRETFLAHTCRKAGLAPDAWRDPGTILRLFESIKFEE